MLPGQNPRKGVLAFAQRWRCLRSPDRTDFSEQRGLTSLPILKGGWNPYFHRLTRQR